MFLNWAQRLKYTTINSISKLQLSLILNSRLVWAVDVGLQPLGLMVKTKVDRYKEFTVDCASREPQEAYVRS